MAVDQGQQGLVSSVSGNPFRTAHQELGQQLAAIQMAARPVVLETLVPAASFPGFNPSPTGLMATAPLIMQQASP